MSDSCDPPGTERQDQPAETQSRPAERRDRPAHRDFLVLAFFAVLVLYPLSTGPVAWLQDRGMAPSGLYDSFYTPLAILSEHSGHASGFFNWYVCRVWEVAPSMDHPIPTAFQMR